MSVSNQVFLFVGGAQKSGTRSLRRYLNQHHNISIQSKPEGHFFDKDKNFINDLPIPHLLKKYQNDFDIHENTNLLCDITPDYIFRKESVTRIFHYNPHANWIILLRNPIDRAYSAWNMEVNRKAENLSFEEALQNEIDGGDENRTHDRFQYIARSQYYPQLLNLWKYFPKSQCCIYSAELLWQEPQVVLNQILKKLNIPINSKIDYKHVHKGVYKSNISIHARNLLSEKLCFEMTKLPFILGWNENPWIKNK